MKITDELKNSKIYKELVEETRRASKVTLPYYGPTLVVCKGKTPSKVSSKHKMIVSRFNKKGEK